MHDQQIINSIHVETLDINDPMQATASQVYEKILNTGNEYPYSIPFVNTKTHS